MVWVCAHFFSSWATMRDFVISNDGEMEYRWTHTKEKSFLSQSSICVLYFIFLVFFNVCRYWLFIIMQKCCHAMMLSDSQSELSWETRHKTAAPGIIGEGFVNNTAPLPSAILSALTPSSYLPFLQLHPSFFGLGFQRRRFKRFYF